MTTTPNWLPDWLLEFKHKPIDDRAVQTMKAAGLSAPQAASVVAGVIEYCLLSPGFMDKSVFRHNLDKAALNAIEQHWASTER